jgi:hypothetical protein
MKSQNVVPKMIDKLQSDSGDRAGRLVVAMLQKYAKSFTNYRSNFTNDVQKCTKSEFNLKE